VRLIKDTEIKRQQSMRTVPDNINIAKLPQLVRKVD